ncbi:MAG TPA: right-handed parallel beta-helix repeat-containing protein [Clostridia bacterium]|nr:right-handed parallel beta-helix repeat-containing protein [Clostridia bacterium]
MATPAFFPSSLALALLLVWQTTSAAAEWYVAPTGNDRNAGTKAKPFATLAQAQQAVRAMLREGTNRDPVTVYLQDGIYPLAKPLVFEPQDSGTIHAPVTYAAAPGARPVLSGGRAIRNWKRHNASTWVAQVPEAKTGWRFRQLFVNGQPRPRAKIPNVGFLRVAACPEGTPKTVHYHKDCQSFQFKHGDIRPDWTNLQDVEVIVYHFWTDSHLPIQSVDPISNIVTFAHKAGKVFTDDFTEDGARYIVENVFEGLDIPGEWYLDYRQGLLYYLPRPGENMNRVEVIAPHLPAFIELRGNAREGRFVQHLVFQGIEFQYTRFELPPGNSNDRQGSASVPAAVRLTGARHCRFDRCTFQNLGTWAVEAGNGCRHNAFVGNQISFIAAGGFRLNGGTERDHPLERTGHNLIADNRLHHYGQVYPSAVGVLLMNTEQNVVEHNLIHHGYYTGISVGWVWGYQRSISQGNRVEFNHIHDIGQGGLLSDMGGIYTLGVSPGTVIRNNLIHDIDANQYGGWGIYHDEGSTHHLVESNVVYRTKFAPFNIHYAKELIVRNNVFAFGHLEQLSRGRHEPHKSVFFENNIVYWQTGDLFSKNWQDAPYTFHLNPNVKPGSSTLTNTFDCDWNLYFNPGKNRDDLRFAGGTWKDWQRRGKDLHSIYADPLFVAPENGNFQLKPGSPAFALGFQPIDMTRVGPRTP